jgi:GH18 family chitinase
MVNEMTLRRLSIFVLSLLLFLVACSGFPTMNTSKSPSFRVIGYVTASVIVEQVPFDKLTHINYAFLIPNADGSFAPMANSWKLKFLAEQAHKNDVKVLISVGGWGWDAQFEEMAADPQKRAVFIDGLVKFVAETGIDGADIDWEYPDPGQSSLNFLALMTELRAALPKDKLLTAAVIAFGDEYGQGVPTESFALMDFINIMTYDGDLHGSMEQFNLGLDYWLGRGLPKEKLVMGVPFYSRPGEVIYRKLVEADLAAAQKDVLELVGALQRYNGVPTIREKTRIALERASGLMIWTIEYDASGDASLLTAINDTIQTYKP